MKTRTRRTPEELAAEYQRKANQARAKAAKQKKDAGLRAQMELGKIARDAGISSSADLQARLVLANLMIEQFGKGGTVRVGGEKHHWAAVDQLFKPSGEARRALFDWWQDQGHPLGPDLRS